MVSEDEVMERLEKIDDPETCMSIVDMGFIYGVEVEEGRVDVEMTLTSPGCPLHSKFTGDVEKEVGKMEDVKEVNVELTFDPPWSPDMMSDEAKENLGME